VRLDVPFPDVVVHLSGLSLQGREHFVEAGTYAVKVKHQCMEAPVFEATFKAGAEIDLAVPHRITCGNVRLTSAIPGVEIQWRGTWHDLPFETPLEPPWTTTVKARAPGHRSQLVSVENPPEGTRAVEVKLPPDRIDVRIDVRRWDDTPCNAPIHIDGQRVGRSPWRGEVSPGRHVITADCGAQLTHTGRFERSAKPIDVRLRQEGPRTEFVLTSTAFNSALLTLRRWSANRRVGGLRASLGLSIGGFGFRDEPAGGLGIEIGAAYAFRSWFEVGLSALGAAGSRTCSATESSPGSHTCYHAYGELRATARAYWGGLVVEGGLGQAGQLYDERSAGRLGPQFGVGLSF
jgi:hypothetical protein